MKMDLATAERPLLHYLHQANIAKRIRRPKGAANRRAMTRDLISKLSIISVESYPKSAKLSLKMNSVSSFRSSSV